MTENWSPTLQNSHIHKPKIMEAGKMSSPKAQEIYSPMTDLANNMSLWELKSGFEDTPKRRLSLSGTGTPTPCHVKGGKIRPKLLEKQLSFESGSCGDASSASAESPFLAHGPIFPSMSSKASGFIPPFKSAALARFGSLPVPFCGFETPGKDVDHIEPHLSPEKFDREGSTSFQEPQRATFIFADDDEEENSRDSGVSLESAGKNQDESFHFAEPHAPAPRRSRVLSEDACSPTKYSPVKTVIFSRSLSFGNLNLQSPHSTSPVLRKSSLTHSPEHDDGDDGFLELLELDEQEHKLDDSAPSGLADLISAPLLLPKIKESTPSTVKKHKRVLQLENQENISPKVSTRRGLFRSPSMPGLRSRVLDKKGSFKRAEPEHRGDDTPYNQIKRKRSCAGLDSPKVKPSRSLHRCHSETEAMIKAALSKVDENQDLIGDFTKAYSLPLATCKHRDLKGISPETMAALLRGEYSHIIEKFVIIDCRYPYEYEGGHLKYAKNIYTRDGIMEEFLKSDKHHKTNGKCGHTALIFHCEFSSERGPKLSRFLRENDRASNKDCYPSLHYPEVYLLEGGYKAFFEKHKDLCEPQTYKPMLHKDHEADLRHFRIKSRTWGGEKSRGNRGPIRTGLKF